MTPNMGLCRLINVDGTDPDASYVGGLAFSDVIVYKHRIILQPQSHIEYSSENDYGWPDVPSGTGDRNE